MKQKHFTPTIDKALPLNEIIRLDEIFSKKGWPRETCFGNRVFDNFCKTLAEFTPEQRELILSLTEDFIWIQPENYVSYFDELFKEFTSSYNFESIPDPIPESEPKSKKNTKPSLNLCPLLPQQDIYKVKSSTALIYLIKGQLKAMQNKYSNFNIVVKDAPDLKRIKSANQNTIICLVDDFLGSGNTAEAAVKELIDKGIPNNKIVVLVLVAMKEGIESLKAKNISVFSLFIREKGITGHENATDRLKTMEEIENRIGVYEEDKFGYNSSESLVRMIRTPNNTFPFFWLSRKGHKAPFPR